MELRMFLGTYVNLYARWTRIFIAVSTPGPFDFEFGISHMKHKLPSLYNVSLKERLEKEAPKSKVYFIHDAAGICSLAQWMRCQSLAESDLHLLCLAQDLVMYAVIVEKYS